MLRAKIILGCGNFGGVGSDLSLVGKGESDEEAFALMDAAWEAGVRRFDTASSYGGGRSERAIGKWIASRRPEGLALTSKVFHPVRDGDDAGLSADRVRRVGAVVGPGRRRRRQQSQRHSRREDERPHLA